MVKNSKERGQGYLTALLGFKLDNWQSKGRGFESPQLHFEAKMSLGSQNE